MNSIFTRLQGRNFHLRAALMIHSFNPSSVLHFSTSLRAFCNNITWLLRGAVVSCMTHYTYLSRRKYASKIVCSLVLLLGQNSHFCVKALSLLNRNKLKSIGLQQGKSAHFQLTQMCIAWRKSLLPAHSVSRIRILYWNEKQLVSDCLNVQFIHLQQQLAFS